MKGLIALIGTMMLSLMLTSCMVQDHPGRRGMPPGHAKRMYRYDRGPRPGPPHGHGHGHGHHKHRGRGHRHH